MVTLIGTLHSTFDMNGPRRLQRILSVLQPRSISIEVPEGILVEQVLMEMDKRIRAEKEVLKRTNAEPWLRQLACAVYDVLCYEFVGAHRYATTASIPMYCVDHPLARKIDEYETNVPHAQDVIEIILVASLSPEAQKELATMQIEQMLDVHARGSRILYQDPKTLDAFIESLPESQRKQMYIEFDISGNERELYMEDQIRRLQPEVHIGGMAHIYEEFAYLGLPEGTVPLCRRIRDITTARYRLSDADNFEAGEEK